MANQEHVERLQQGSDHWNTWRKENLAWRLDLWQPDLREANLSKAKLSGADLLMADLSGANLEAADLIEANLGGADLSGANLQAAILIGAYLSEANLSRADLRGACLNGADLHKAKLSEASLFGAYLNGADLHKAKLSEANLYDAALREANLSGANLSGANLSGANLSGAFLFSTIFAKTDLRTVQGLTAIHHEGPSDIELFSVQLPQDGSALHFLRGVGVPDEWIDDYRARMMQPIQYYSCFISYSSKDEILAKRLHADLQDQGVRCWFAPEDMKIGERIRQRIDEAIHLQDKLLLLLSEHSLASTWVEDEVEAAFAKEQRQKREVLFPIRLDDTVMQTTQAWAAKLQRTRHIGDFTKWETAQEYRKAFERLLRNLKQQ